MQEPLAWMQVHRSVVLPTIDEGLHSPPRAVPGHAGAAAPVLQAAIDFRADPMLYEACKDDSESLCKGIKNGGGRIQACLVSCPSLQSSPSARHSHAVLPPQGCRGMRR